MPWAGAVVAVLLTTLLHVLACSHGPTAAPALRADAVLPISPASYGQSPSETDRQASAGPSTPAPDRDADCQDLDEPTVQPSRDLDPSWPLPAVLSADPSVTDPFGPLPAPHHCPASSTASSAGHARALLGVWRT
ncbi:hypothetical protein [Streptomyces sp. NPDC052042]|uniref:hypothetical protein n=1 Tax=Streptomyces sp. NPDC052042 TaxID=3365683 RepID=UPI0037D3FBF2